MATLTPHVASIRDPLRTTASSCAARPQFANATFRYVYTNVLDHVPPVLIPIFFAEVRRVLKLRGTLWLDMDAHPPDRFAHASIAKVSAARGAKVRGRIDASATLTAAGFEVLRRRPFCTSQAQLRQAMASGECLRGNPTADGGVDPAGGIALAAT